MRSLMRQNNVQKNEQNNKKNHEQSNQRLKTRLEMIGAAAFWLLLWQFAAVFMGNDILLVGPLEMLSALFQLFSEPTFWHSIGNSFLRIGAGFLLAAGTGVFLGACAYRFSLLRTLLSPPVSLMKSIPVASFVILAIIWLGGTKNLSIFVSFVVVFPMTYLNTISGLLSTDRKLLEMSEVFRISAWKKWRFIYIPALLPYLFACFRISLGMAWKSGVAAELIGQPANTIGNSLYQAKIFLDTPALFAWTFTIIVISLLFEKAVLLALRLASTERRESRRTEEQVKKIEKQDNTEKWNHAEKQNRTEMLKNLEKLPKPGIAENSGEAGFCAVRWDGISQSFGDVNVFHDFSGRMEAPGVYALSGESGSGKTTFFRMLLGLQRPDRGIISWTGICSETMKRPPCAAVFQEDRLCEQASAADNVLLCMRKGSAGREQLRKKVREELRFLLPEECLDKPVGKLSGGQKRRVALVRAMLAPETKAVFLDEPFTGLDEETKQLAIRYVQARLGERLLVLATHDAADRSAFSVREEHVIRIAEQTEMQTEVK